MHSYTYYFLLYHLLFNNQRRSHNHAIARVVMKWNIKAILFPNPSSLNISLA